MTLRVHGLLCGVVVFVTCFFGGAGCAHKPRVSESVASGTAQWRPELPVYKKRLPNGLTALLIADRNSPAVTMTTTVRVGSVYEVPGKTGLAHLFEHLMFKGTQKFPEQFYIRELESFGAELNAYTSKEKTVYYEVFAPRYLERILELESDRLVNLVVDQRKLDIEREIVKEERRRTLESDFFEQAIEKIFETAFPNSAYGWPTVGSMADLNKASVEDCMSFYREYYRPSNVLITIAGDIDVDATWAQIERFYGPIGSPSPSHFHEHRMLLAPPKLSASKRSVSMQLPVRGESIYYTYYIPSMFHEDLPALGVLAAAGFGLTSSIARSELVRKKQVALDVGAEAMQQPSPYVFAIWATAREGKKLSLLESELAKVISSIQRGALSQSQLDAVKNHIVYGIISSAKSSEGVASLLSSAEFYWGDYKKQFELIDLYQSVTLNDLQRVAKKYLIPENRVRVAVLPSAKSKQRSGQ